MANRANHYDAAFEEYLRGQKVPYVAVDETRRSLFDESSLKSPDYIVSPPGHNWLIDIKGRKFPSGGEPPSHVWENWATRDDIDSMLRWQEVFGVGAGFRAMLVFAYHVLDARWLWQFDRRSRWEHKGASYAFYGVWVDDYEERMSERSRQWGTVSLRKRAYEELRFPLGGIIPVAGDNAMNPRETAAAVLLAGEWRS
jgi:hypothetical protein